MAPVFLWAEYGPLTQIVPRQGAFCLWPGFSWLWAGLFLMAHPQGLGERPEPPAEHYFLTALIRSRICLPLTISSRGFVSRERPKGYFFAGYLQSRGKRRGIIPFSRESQPGMPGGEKCSCRTGQQIFRHPGSHEAADEIHYIAGFKEPLIKSRLAAWHASRLHLFRQSSAIAELLCTSFRLPNRKTINGLIGCAQ